jgi:hypothetical protein
MFLSDEGGYYDNMGVPFTILNVYMGGTTVFQASVVLGGSGGTPGTVTLTVAGGTFTTAATLTGTVSAAGVLTAVSVLTGGAYTVLPTSPATVTGTGVPAGATVAVSGSVFKMDTTLAAIPTYQTSITTTVTIASPAVFSSGTTSLANGTPVLLQTTGALPTGFTAITTIYFVVGTAGTTPNFTFNLSATPGGAAINSTGTQSGTHTAIINPLHFNPHPCPRFTCINNTGHHGIIDLNGAVDEPLFSRWKRMFAGHWPASSQLNYQNTGRVWGKLVQLTVNVIQAGTAGTATIACPGFTQPNLGASNFSQVINLTIAGVRTVTATAVSGAQTGDTLTAYADWLAGGTSPAGRVAFTNNFNVTVASSPGPMSNNAVFEVEVITDQQITRFGTVHYNDTQTNSAAQSMIIDSSIQWYWPTNP